jgi:ATP-dependent helicase HepA
MTYSTGQRWASAMEPELGLGIINNLEHHRIQIHFPTADVTRIYSTDAPPLKRVHFRSGDKVSSDTNGAFIITSVSEQNGLFTYHGETQTLSESDISDTISFLSPIEKLLSGNVDSLKEFEIRQQTIKHNHNYHTSDIKGYTGPRVSLFPHQLHIAEKALSLHHHRLLLADEVGLGKTIEACLILHQLLTTSVIERVLIIVPDTLVFQWFVELYRKFNFSFAIFDQSFYKECIDENMIENPFQKQQLGLTDMTFVFENSDIQDDLLDGDWDLVIVDEAHRIALNQDHYQWLELLAKQTPHLLLLTATPEVLGYQSIFDLCRLLYPQVYSNYQTFLKYTQEFATLSTIIEQLETDTILTSNEQNWIKDKLHLDQSHLNALNKLSTIKLEHKKEVIQALLDNYGLGHIIFRNTRKQITSLPKRKVHFYTLDHNQEDTFTQEFMADLNLSITSKSDTFIHDARILWLVQFLKDSPSTKLLIMCHTKTKVKSIQKALNHHIKRSIALFHEDLSLLQRDKNAAFFSEEDGANILICSEIGSEGRNFQFVQHLCFFDVPLNMELIEQRIGRLDRIGQKGTVNIHIPYAKNTPQSRMINWLHSGCHIFSEYNPAGNRLLTLFKERIIQYALNQNKTESFDIILSETLSSASQIAKELEAGRDKLLEKNAYHSDNTQSLTQHISTHDKNGHLDQFMESLFDHFGIEISEIGPRNWIIKARGDCSDIFPGFIEKRMTVTFDRTIGTTREDYLFLTWDHPMVRGAIDMLLSSEQGNTSFAKWTDSESENIYLEATFLVECIAPPSFQVDKYIPLTPITITIDIQGIPSKSILKGAPLINGTTQTLNTLVDQGKEQISSMIQAASEMAEEKQRNICSEAISKMKADYQQRINETDYLIKVNPHISKDDIGVLEEKTDKLKEYMSNARCRLDSVRLIIRGC